MMRKLWVVAKVYVWGKLAWGGMGELEPSLCRSVGGVQLY
jgi:hypothetical protein